MTDDKYIPGVCNIGPQEIKRRRQAGIIGLIGIVVMLAVLMFRKKDRQKALQILIYSIIIGILVAGTTYVLPEKDLEIYRSLLLTNKYQSTFASA